MSFTPDVIRREFPLLNKEGVIYLDNAATTQKPRVVLDAMTHFYEESNANVNRGVHALAERATNAYDLARSTVRAFISAKHQHEIIFTRNATEGINLVARTFGETLKQGDAIAITQLEHHSNIVPWQQLQERKGIDVRWIEIADDGTINEESLEHALKDKNVRLVAVTAVSNVLGTIIDLSKIISAAHNAGALVLVDAAQMTPHATIDVAALDCDFLVFSGHKVYGPTGIGVLYGKESILEKLPTFLGGGDMIQTVTMKGFTPAELPRKFEAGTPAIAEAVGLDAALTWLSHLGLSNIAGHEQALLGQALERLQAIKNVRVLGPQKAEKIASCISFVVDNMHPHDLTQILSESKVMMRAGHHCTQPLHARLGITASTRLSVAAYNTREDIDQACDAIEDAITSWGK